MKNLSIIRTFCWLVYNLFAKNLPGNYTPFGKISKKIRLITCKKILKKCGCDVDIGNNVIFFNLKKCEVGDNSGIGAWSSIGSVVIGKNVMMGTHCLIISQNHKFDRIDIPMCTQGFSEDKPVTIEDDVWIGSRVIILPGVKVRRGSIVGAGSVVTKDVSPYSIVAGNPARIVRSRLGNAK